MIESVLKKIPTRESFKYLHRIILGKGNYSTSNCIDLVDKYPLPFIVARLDFKLSGDRLHFPEVLAHNHLSSLPDPFWIPIFIVQATEFDKDITKHRFMVHQYMGGDPIPEPPVINLQQVGGPWDWQELGKWEKSLRIARKKYMETCMQTVEIETIILNENI